MSFSRTQSLPDLRGRRVTVMGLGSFGGGLGAVRYLVQQGAHVTVTDQKPATELAGTLAELADTPPAACHLGGHELADFVESELIVMSPAVPRDNWWVAQARNAGVPVTSEMNLFWERNPAPVIAVTGSNGKSTTSAMTHAILQATGRTCWLGGNIGRSLLPVVEQIQPEDYVVLELSSFQLEDLDRLQASPQVGIVTNFSPNHLDRHGTLEDYRTAKQTLLRWQSATDFCVLNQGDADVAEWSGPGQRLWFGLSDQGRSGLFLAGSEVLWRHGTVERRFPLPDWVSLPGRHNLENALAASCAALALNTELGAVEQGLRSYRALPHRLELVVERGGRKFYNDSLATTPESAIVALAAFTQPVVLLAGGYDKGSDLTDMARQIVQSSTKAVALMGTTAPVLERLIRTHDPSGRITLTRLADFPATFAWAVENSAPGDVILLSPGCASYDWFRNFADRGEQFRQLAQNWGPPLAEAP